MNIHIGKAILKELRESGMTNSEFGRRINKAPQTVNNILTRESIDTALLLDISKVLKYNFFSLYEDHAKQLGAVAEGKDQIKRLTENNKQLKKEVEKQGKRIATLEKQTVTNKKNPSKSGAKKK